MLKYWYNGMKEIVKYTYKCFLAYSNKFQHLENIEQYIKNNKIYRK